MPDSTVETTCVLKSSAMCESKTEIVNFFQDNQIRGRIHKRMVYGTKHSAQLLVCSLGPWGCKSLAWA